MKTKNYYLKEIVPSDIKNIHRGLSNPEVTKYYDVHFETLKDTEEQMDWYRDLKEKGTGLWWGIYDGSDDQFLGAGGYCALEKEHQKAEIGLWLLKEHWGKGILKEVMPLIFELGFTDLDLNRIEGYVHNDNTKCRNALGKINFSHEGTLREFEVKNGKPIDVDVYSILKRDWITIN